MSINISSCDTLCYKGSAKYNEDIVGVTPWGAWVLDGATGLNNKNLVCKESDAKWYVNWWNKYLYKNINKDSSLKEIMIEGIKNIKLEYYSKIEKSKIEKLDTPSSSISIIKYRDNIVEYLLLGDCSLHMKIGENTHIIKDRTICKLDKIVYDEMENLDNLSNLSFEEIKTSVMQTIINNRLKKNTENGYWILEFEEKAIDKAIYGEIKVNQPIDILMASDGFSCISDRYNLINEYNLLDCAINDGIGVIYSKLRSVEEDDFKTIKFPRFKVKDDSSCVYLNLD